MLPKTSTYIKSYDGQTKWMYLDKVSADIKKEPDSHPVCNKIF